MYIYMYVAVIRALEEFMSGSSVTTHGEWGEKWGGELFQDP